MIQVASVNRGDTHTESKYENGVGRKKMKSKWFYCMTDLPQTVFCVLNTYSDALLCFFFKLNFLCIIQKVLLPGSGLVLNMLEFVMSDEGISNYQMILFYIAQI